MVEPMPEPDKKLHDPAELLAGYLDYFREGVLRKFEGMTDAQVRESRLPSGWTPIQLLKHLSYVELRWLRWGFAAERVETPWGDEDSEEKWYVAPTETVEEIKAFFREQCAKSRAIAASANLTDQAATGGRFESEEDAPTLAWIQFHVLQEYARHLGHLDIARELSDGTTGE